MTATNALIASSPAGVDDTVIRCAGLTKVFRDFWMRNRVKAVDAIDLDVRRGEVFGLLGPNGSGKSTTIKMMLGLLHPTSGRISVFGKRPDDVETKKRIGYLPEESYLYRFLNARETLEYYGRLFHQDRHQRQRRIDQLLEYVGLQGVQRRPVGEYSKGMQRRIGLAQALINDPQLLILDEPTSGLDPIGTRQIKDLILELSRRGKTILLCSHLLSDVEDVCDRVAIMFGGKVRAQGTCDELLVQSNSTLLQTGELDVEMVQAVEATLGRFGKHIEKVEQPRQKLEALFLDIVHKAQAEGVATSGAQSGGRLAEFLVRSGELPEGEEPQRVLDELIAKKPAPSKAEPTTTPLVASLAAAKATPAEPEAKPDEKVLGNLMAEQWGSTKEARQEPGVNDSPVPGSPRASDISSGPKDRAVVDRRLPPSAAAKVSPDGEKPDSSFIDALMKVEPYKDEDAGKPKPAEGGGSERPEA